MTEKNKLIGSKIQQLRLNCGEARKTLAKLLGMSHQQVFKYEKGHSRIHAEMLFYIAQHYGVEINYFYEDFVEKGDKDFFVPRQRINLEMSRSLMKITNPSHQDAINHLIKTLATQQ